MQASVHFDLPMSRMVGSKAGMLLFLHFSAFFQGCLALHHHFAGQSDRACLSTSDIRSMDMAEARH